MAKETDRGFDRPTGNGLGRTAAKRNAIMETATSLFLRNGYHRTSMDQVAAEAEVSKQTVYKQFADKEQLFTEIVSGVAANSDDIIADLTAVLEKAEVESAADLQAALTALARRYLDAVLQPKVLALRRLIIAEAERFPDLARHYYERAPARGIEVIADAFGSLADRGLLTTPDPRLAAGHFAYLALSISQDRAMFCPHDPPTTRQRQRIATEAARVFLAAYGNA